MYDQPLESNVPRLALRTRDAAKALGVSERTLFSWTNDPDCDIPVIRRGGAVLYPVADLAAWLSNEAKRTGGDC